MNGFKLSALAVGVSLAIVGCGGSSSTTSTTTTTSSLGLTLPSEISAVPASTTSNSAHLRSFGGAVRALARAAQASGLPATSDYVLTKGRTFIEEPALEQFDIIEGVLTSLAQTNYAQEVGNGAYQAVVAWEEDGDGVGTKELQTWTMKSEMVDGTHPVTNAAQKVNVVQAWIPEIDPSYGTETLIKAQFEIYTAATVADDGSFDDYGEWDLNVYFDADPAAVDTTAPNGFFAASARITNGQTTLKVVDRGMRNEFNLIEQMKGVLVRSPTSGYGKVQFPDWEKCYNPNSGTDCSVLTEFPSDSAAYSYNDRYLGVQELNDPTTNTDDGPVVYKDRDLTGAIKMVHRYGLFYAEANANSGIEEGENIEKKLAFGFPVRYNMKALKDASKTFEAWGYYGAWQGRHELWGPEGFVVDDGTNTDTTATVFTKADVAPGQTAATYSLVEFAGTFTRRSLVDATLDDIKGVPVQTWLNKHSDLFYMSGAWRSCAGYIDWQNFNPNDMTTLQCLDRSTNQVITGNGEVQGFASYDITQLALGQNDQRWIFIDGDNGNGYTQYIYLASDPGNGFDFSGGAGFYEAGNSVDQNTGRPLANSPAAKLSPTGGENLSVNISGQLFVEYVGFAPDYQGSATTTGWVQKEYTGEDPVTHQPQFGVNDIAFNPSRDEEYYINAAGSNYIVKRKGTVDEAASYDVKRELQMAANPENTNSTNSASIIPTGASYLATPWNREVTYELIEDPANAKYLLLVVKTDSTGSLTAGTIADTQWGLVAYNSSNQPLALVGTTVTPVTVDEFGFPVTGQQRPMEFNWEKPRDGQNWGKQRFLKDRSNSQYVILSNPIALNGVAITDSAGNSKGTLNLQFDGWMHGMPDMYHELEKNGWEMSADIAGKVVHIPAGTEATGDDSTRYFVKPIDSSLFLGVVNAFPNGTQPDMTQVDSVNFNDMPSYTAHNMGATPTGTTIKYTEGKAVE